LNRWGLSSSSHSHHSGQVPLSSPPPCRHAAKRLALQRRAHPRSQPRDAYRNLRSRAITSNPRLRRSSAASTSYALPEGIDTRGHTRSPSVLNACETPAARSVGIDSA
jgi:hypothetical protein